MAWRRAIFAAFGPAVVALLAPGVAGAASVAVTVDGSLHGIVFDSAPGETNAVSLGVVGEVGDPTTYSIVDANSPTVAGSGCAGGGPPGAPVTCALPRSALPCVIRGCPAVDPVQNHLEVHLGDGDDSLDSTGVPATDGGTGGLYVIGDGGPGVDRFTDGPSSGRFDPGTGADTVTGGLGYDSVVASGGSIDEADVYDLGTGPYDAVDYRAATYPLTVTLDDVPNDGGADEGDQVLGAEVVLGGHADDHLTGSGSASAVEQIDGHDGDDLIEGGPGYDLLTGHGGDDTIFGERGRDRIHGDWSGPGHGDDRLSGGVGRDFVQGWDGRDAIKGGFGADLLVGATSVDPDEEVDRLDCGPSRDRRAYVGVEDRVRRCERVLVAG